VISEFTEFSYGFAVTHELILQNSGNVVAAPEFPSLIRERSLRFRVALEYISFVAHVFLHSEVFFVPATP